MTEEAEPVEAAAVEESGSDVFAFVDGSKYDGSWRRGPEGQVQRHGTGAHADGPESYEGGWQHDRMHGEGLFKFAAGATYQGTFVADQFHGEGTYTWPDGATYVGGWRENKMHGEGAYTDADGVRWSGDFFNGKYNNGKVFVPLREASTAGRKS